MMGPSRRWICFDNHASDAELHISWHIIDASHACLSSLLVSDDAINKWDLTILHDFPISSLQCAVSGGPFVFSLFAWWNLNCNYEPSLVLGEIVNTRKLRRAHAQEGIWQIWFVSTLFVISSFLVAFHRTFNRRL